MKIKAVNITDGMTVPVFDERGGPDKQWAVGRVVTHDGITVVWYADGDGVTVDIVSWPFDEIVECGWV